MSIQKEVFDMRKGFIVLSLLVLVLCAGFSAGDASGQSEDKTVRLYKKMEVSVNEP